MSICYSWRYVHKQKGEYIDGQMKGVMNMQTIALEVSCLKSYVKWLRWYQHRVIAYFQAKELGALRSSTFENFVVKNIKNPNIVLISLFIHVVWVGFFILCSEIACVIHEVLIMERLWVLECFYDFSIFLDLLIINFCVMNEKAKITVLSMI